MFGTIRKHQTWLWILLIGLMSVSLVALFSSTDLGGGGGSRRNSGSANEFGSINGQPIDIGEYGNAWREIRIASYLRTGKWLEEDDYKKPRMEQEIVSRVFLLHRLRDMDIKASDRAVAMMMQQELPRDYPLATLEKEVLAPKRLTLADYDRYVRNESALRQLIAAATVTARLITPNEAESLWRKENQELSGKAACFWASNYLSKIVLTNGAIETFYSNRMAFYRLPERQVLGFVEFNASNYFANAESTLAKHTNLNDIISDIYSSRLRNNTNAWTDTNGVPLAETAAKDKIREELRHSEAMVAARRAAAEFGTELMARPEPNQVTNLEFLAAQKQLTVRLTNPFDSRTNGLDEFETDEIVQGRGEDAPRISVRDLVRQKAFGLTDDRPILFNPIPGKDAVYVIARKGRVPSELQPLAKIKDRVTADYRNGMALELARKAAMTFHTDLTNGLALKKSFDELCAAEKVPVIDVPPFSLSSKALPGADPRINLNQLRGMSEGLEPGQATAPIHVSEGVYIFYAQSRPPIDPAKLQAELPDFVNQLRILHQNEAFQQWFRRQAEQAHLTVPKHESVGAQN